jgi:benzodiazapine receptor
MDVHFTPSNVDLPLSSLSFSPAHPTSHSRTNNFLVLLNNLWTPLFFGLRAPILASVDILALLGTITYLIYTWGQVDKVAIWTLLPYWMWVAFASYVCIGTAVVNGWDLRTKEDGKAQ